jgi:hypothetical protein
MPRSNQTNKKSPILKRTPPPESVEIKTHPPESVEIKPLDSAKSSKELIESLSDVEIAWMAGLLEGEGSFGLDKRSKQRYENSTSPPGPYVKISMTDEDVIEKMAKLVNIYTIVCVPNPFNEKKQKSLYPSYWRSRNFTGTVTSSLSLFRKTTSS